MSLIGSGFAAAWVASALYLGRVFQRREHPSEASASAADARTGTIAEQRT
jgi:hypothetical protein